MDQLLTILGWVLSPVCAALVTALVKERRKAVEKMEAEEAKAIAEQNEQKEWREAVEKALRVLLRQQLIEYHRDFVASGNPCPVRIKEQATSVHDAYHALGGNGTGTQLWQEIMEAHVE